VLLNELADEPDIELGVVICTPYDEPKCHLVHEGTELEMEVPDGLGPESG